MCEWWKVRVVRRKKLRRWKREGVRQRKAKVRVLIEPFEAAASSS